MPGWSGEAVGVSLGGGEHHVVAAPEALVGESLVYVSGCQHLDAGVAVVVVVPVVESLAPGLGFGERRES